jgi:Zn-dependent M28 family amino/carboxypeptidase
MTRLHPALNRPIAYGIALVGLTVSGCKQEPHESEAAVPLPASAKREEQGVIDAGHAAITPELLRTHTRALADDSFEGRLPGSEGGRKTVAYILEAFQQLGLEPAGKDGWTQTVWMRSVTTDRSATRLQLVHGRGSIELEFGPSFVASTDGEAGAREIDFPLVFAGYGITAPEYGWNDYRGVDVRGKIVVVFVGDPPVPDERFAGPKALTYYGRWTYKFERALEAGAAGCIVIHEPKPASYEWHVVQNGWVGERLHTLGPNGELPPALAIKGWINDSVAERLAAASGASLAHWHASAETSSFRVQPLNATLRGTLVTGERRISDVNVLGRVPGSSNPEEAVLVTAHWDHLGMKSETSLGEDRIFNGAIDNASGIAGLLALAAGARARVHAGDPPGRSIVFLATTAEEQGLLGSRVHAADPVVPLPNLVAVFNLDSMNVHGRTKTVEVIGSGHTTLEDLLTMVAQRQGRVVVADEHPERGSYYRSDHFSFAKLGIPALYFRGGLDMERGGIAAGQALLALKAKAYHTVDDEFQAAWEFTGAEQDAEAVLDLAFAVADSTVNPQWKPSSEFARIRRPR